MQKITSWGNLTIILLMLSLTGCSSTEQAGLVKVSGQVLIDGEPVPHGIVRLAPPNSRPSQGRLDEQGRFTLGCYDLDDGAVIGVHQVEVAASEILDPQKIRWHAPKKYASISTSELSVEVTAATDSLVIELTWDGGQTFVEKTR